MGKKELLLSTIFIVSRRTIFAFGIGSGKMLQGFHLYAEIPTTGAHYGM
jgi:hypothetical protein